MANDKRPGVGAAVFIMKNGKFIMVLRQGAHGADSWGLPGGHLEFGESWEEGVRREAREEVGLEIKNVRFVAATNDIFQAENKHYITLFMVADWESGEGHIMEPEKCQAVDWFSYDTMPKNVFLPLINLRRDWPDLGL